MKKQKLFGCLLGLLLSDLTVPLSSARAMHVSEGILPFSWAVFWFLTAVPFLALGLYRLKKTFPGRPLF